MKTPILKTKKGTWKADATEIRTLMEHPDVILRPCQWRGSARFLSLQDKRGTITTYLNKLGVQFETGNDAPRGGVSGCYIKLTEMGKEQIKALQV